MNRDTAKKRAIPRADDTHISRRCLARTPVIAVLTGALAAPQTHPGRRDEVEVVDTTVLPGIWDPRVTLGRNPVKAGGTL